MFDPIFQAVGYLLAFFYRFVPPHNLGLAIILMTVTIMILLFPLNAKQARSMIEMQRAQPEIKKLQAKYRDDKQKLNEEILKFYQEHQINPLSGCLPILVQMPVLLILYRVIHDVKGHVPTSGSFNQLYQDACAKSDALCTAPGQKFLGLELTKSAQEARSLVGFGGWLPYLLALVAIVGTGWYQAQQTMARQKRSGNAPQMANQMQMVTKVMPFIFGFTSFYFASGLVVYWVTRNVWLIGQQHFVINKLYEEAQAKGALGSDGGDRKQPKGEVGAGESAGGSKKLEPKAPGSNGAKPKPGAGSSQRPRDKRKKKR